MCGKGSQTTTQNTQQTQTPNPQAMSLYQDILRQAQQTAGTPYSPFPGQGVAPINPQQYSGIANINQYQPAYQTALGMAYQGAQPITQAQIQQYQSPYTQDVINATMAQFANQNAAQNQSLLGNAAAQGALGGNRVGVAQGQLVNQEQLAQAPVIANLQNQGYMTGLNTALTEQQALAQGAYGVAGAANAGLGGANVQIGAGTLEQQTQQAQDTYAYQQYLASMGYPFQTTQWLAGLGTGVGSQMGGTSTGYGTTTGPPPNSTSQWLGLGAAGLGAFGSYAGSAAGSAALAALLARGGGVTGYANGGGVAGYGSIPESHHTLRAQQRQLVAGDRHVQMFPHGTPELPLPRGMQRTESHSGVFHHNPKHVKADEIHKYARGGHEHVLLGLGPHSKHEILHRLNRGEHPIVVVERNEHGHEVRAALGTHATANAQHQHMMRGKSKNHTVHIEHPHKVLSERIQHIGNRQSGGGVSNYQLFGGGYGQPLTPYSGGTSFIPGIGMTPGHTMPTGMQPPPSAGQTPQQQSSQFNAGVAKNLGSFMSGLQKLDSSGRSSGPLAGLTPPSSDTSDYVSSTDAADMAAMEQADTWRGGAVGVANYAGGGNVIPFPSSSDRVHAMTLDEMQDNLNKLMTRDTLSRTLGGTNNVLPMTPSGKARGGIAGYDDGGDVPYQVASLEQSNPPVQSYPSEDEALAYGPAREPGIPLPAPRPIGSDSATATGEDIAPQVPTPRERPIGVAGSEPVETIPSPREHAMPRGIRNNNPGNIEDGPFARNQPGYVGSDGRFAQFESPQAGQAATSALLGTYGSKGINTISGIINRWAPAADNNDTNAYIRAVSKATGYNPSEPLDMSDPSVRTKIADAIHVHENGVGGGPNLAADYQRAYGGLDIPPSTQATARAQAPAGVAPASGNFFSQNKELWPALMAAGFGMMASRSPFLGVAVGEGAQEGLGYYTQQQQIRESERLNQAKVDNEATRLANEADYHEKQLKQQAMLHAETMAETKRLHEENLMKPLPAFNPDTHQPDYQQRTPSGDIYWTSNGQIFAGPHRGQNISDVPPEEYNKSPAVPPGPAPAQPSIPNVKPQAPNPNAPSVQAKPGIQTVAAPQEVNSLFQPAVFRDNGAYKVAAQWAGDNPGPVATEDGDVQAPTTKQFDYSDTKNIPPHIPKGMRIPDPAPFGDRGSAAIVTDAEHWLATGQEPKGVRAGQMGMSNQSYINMVKNYGAALAQSMGIDDIENYRANFKKAAGYAFTPDGRQAVSAGVAIDHLDTIQEAYNAMSKDWNGWLAPGSNQYINGLKAKLAQISGQPGVEGLYAAANIVGPEIMKSVVVGGGGVNERGEQTAEWSPVKSPEQFAAVMKKMKELLAGQLEGKERQAASINVAPETFQRVVGDKAYKELKAIQAARNQPNQQQTTAPAAVNTAAPAATTAQQQPTRIFQGTTYDLKPGGNPKNKDDWIPRPPQSQ